MLRGLCQLGNIPVASLATGRAFPETGDILVVLPEGPPGDRSEWALHMTRLEQDWIAPLLKKLRAGKIQRLDVVTVHAGLARRWTVSARDLWKFWVPAGPLAVQLGSEQ